MLLPESIYPSPGSVRRLVSCFVVLFFLVRYYSNLRLLLLCFLQVPQRARGYLFEYEIVKMLRTGAMIMYNNRIYKPGADSFECLQETEEQQTMTYPATLLDDSHETWQKANSRVNARLFNERQALLKRQAEEEPELEPDDQSKLHDMNVLTLEREIFAESLGVNPETLPSVNDIESFESVEVIEIDGVLAT